MCGKYQTELQNSVCMLAIPIYVFMCCKYQTDCGGNSTKNLAVWKKWKHYQINIYQWSITG